MLHQMPLLGHELGRRLVDQVAMLDALDAGIDRGPDGPRRVGVHGDIGAPVFGCGHGGA